MSLAEGNKSKQYMELNESRIHFPNEIQLSDLLKKDLILSDEDFILADTNTSRLCFPILKILVPELNEERLIILDAGEYGKNISTLNHIWSFLQHAGADKNSRLVNLGGGVITDIGGFAASTFKRGIRFVHIPTSLMGMADASIGGKTAINLGKVKNQVGLFSLPEQVIIYHGFLKTLAWEEFLSGYAELIKIGLAFDRSLWELLSEVDFQETNREYICSQLEDSLLPMAIESKIMVTTRDLTDRGERQCLNFGHSIAHAIEALFLSEGNEIKHGFAVAAGIICEAWISNRVIGLSALDMGKIQSYILEYFPCIPFQEDDIDDILQLLRHDKKNYDGDILMSLLTAPGKCIREVKCSENIIRESLLHYQQLS